MDYYVYITTNPSHKVLYTGVTNSLERRILEHYKCRGDSNSFAGKYYCYLLVYFDTFPSAYEAISAEKLIKGKSRKWKERLIHEFNPTFSYYNKMLYGKWPPDY